MSDNNNSNISSSLDFETYRYYQCVMSPHGYQCNKVLDHNYTILDNSRLSFVNKNTPHIFDNMVLKYKLIPKISIPK